MVPEGVSGVYRIRNVHTGGSYIGASKNLRRRLRQQAARLRRSDRNCNPNLLDDWRKSGEDAFVFEVLLICSPDNLTLYEQLATDALQPTYNKRLLDVASNSGVRARFSPEALARLRQRTIEMNRTRSLSDRTREKMAVARRASAKKYNFRGEHLSIREASEKYQLPEPTLRMRLKAGWDVERALAEPPKPDRRRG